MISLVFSFDPKPVIAFGFSSAKTVLFFEETSFVDFRIITRKRRQLFA